MKHPKGERTFIMVKPDGVQRGLIGEVIKRFEGVGLKLIGIKMLVPEAGHVEEHYTLDPEWRRITGEKTIKSYQAKGLMPPSNDPLKITEKILANLKRYLSSGPIVVMAWEGANAVTIVRKLGGGTEPLTSDVGTIRGDYVVDSYALADADNRAVRNIIHMSGSVPEAEMEISHWFKKGELIDYKVIHEKILYDVDLDGILE